MGSSLKGISRRNALSILAIGGVAGCGMVGRSPFFSTIATFRKSASPAIDRGRIDSLPYASLVAWFDGGARALLVLGDYGPESRLVWYSAEHQALTTWGPFVVSLIGTDVSLRSSDLEGLWNPDLREMSGKTVRKTLDFQAPSNRVTVGTESKFSKGEPQVVKLIEERRELYHYREKVKADHWHNYENEYWVDDKSGICWRSRQVVIPTMPKLNIILAKAPKGSGSK